MINFINKNAGVIVLVAIVIATLYGLFGGASRAFGTAAPSGYISFFNAVAGKYGFYVGDYSSNTQVIDDNGYFVQATTTYNGNGAPVTYQTIGGIDYAYVQQSMAATSSVVCSIPNPFGAATSTPLSFIAQVTTNGIGVAQTLDLSTSTTAYASSTPAFVKKYAAGTGQFTMVWTPGFSTSTNPTEVLSYGSFSATGDSAFRLAPSGLLNFNIATGSAGTFASYYTGTCSAVFMKP